MPWLCLLTNTSVAAFLCCNITQYNIYNKYTISNAALRIWNLIILCVWELRLLRLFHPCVSVPVLFWAAPTALPGYWDPLKFLIATALSRHWHWTLPHNNLYLLLQRPCWSVLTSTLDIAEGKIPRNLSSCSDTWAALVHQQLSLNRTKPWPVTRLGPFQASSNVRRGTRPQRRFLDFKLFNFYRHKWILLSFQKVFY